MKQAYSKLAWGFLFVMFDFRINGVDVLPDVIGFVLFAMAAAQLGRQNESFAQLKTINMIMIVLSLLTVYQRPATIDEPSNIFGILLGVLTTAVGLIVVYRIFQGVGEIGVSSGQIQIKQDAERWWKAYLIVEVAGLLMMILIIIPPVFVVGVIVLFIASILVMVQIMRFLFHAGDVLGKQEESYE